MTPRPADEDEGGAEPTPITSTQRSRWATRKLTVKSSGLKRLSLKNRNNHGNALGIEKKRASGHSGKSDSTAGQSDSPPPTAGGHAGKDDADEQHSEPRTIFCGLPLADEFKDDEGHPTQQYPRNKIRTAKYTPLSFVPKNLWFQFHNIANIFFLFVVILVVSSRLLHRCAAPLHPLSLGSPLPPADYAHPCSGPRASDAF